MSNSSEDPFPLRKYQGKQMAAQGIAVLTVSFFFNINTNITELRNVARYRFSVAGDAVFL